MKLLTISSKFFVFQAASLDNTLTDEQFYITEIILTFEQKKKYKLQTAPVNLFKLLLFFQCSPNKNQFFSD